MAFPRTVKLNGVEYVLGPFEKMRYLSQEQIRQGASIHSFVESDALLNPEAAFSRYRYSWHHGAGQTFDDLNEDSDPFRFNTSTGLEVFEEGKLTLLHDKTLVRSYAASSSKLAVVGGYLYHAQQTNIYRTSDGVVWTTLTVPGGTIHSICTDGQTLYVGTTTNVVKYTSASINPVPFATPIGPTDWVGYAAGNLFISFAATLAQVAAAGTYTVIKTHFNPAFNWYVYLAVGSRIYVGGNNGYSSELYSLTVTTTGALAISNEAASFPNGELLHVGVAHAGVVLFGSNRGVRLAQVGSDGTLTYGPLVELGGNCASIFTEGRFAYVGAGSGGIISLRLALDTFTDTLKPAYATDVQGGVGAQTESMARFAGRTWVATTTDLYKTNDAYLVDGWLASGRIYFGTVEPKFLANVIARFAGATASGGLAANDIVTIYAQNGAMGAVQAIGNVDNSTSLEITRTMIEAGILMDTPDNWFKILVHLAGSGTTTPEFRHWRARAYPAPVLVRQWIIPLTIAPVLRRGGGGGRHVGRNVDSMQTGIAALATSQEPVPFVIGATSTLVRVMGFEFAPSGWSDNGQSLLGEMLVKLVEVT